MNRKRVKMSFGNRPENGAGIIVRLAMLKCADKNVFPKHKYLRGMREFFFEKQKAHLAYVNFDPEKQKSLTFLVLLSRWGFTIFWL